jgi:hypothetical protein
MQPSKGGRARFPHRAGNHSKSPALNFGLRDLRSVFDKGAWTVGFGLWTLDYAPTALFTSFNF